MIQSDDLDFDDLICQNIIVRHDEPNGQDAQDEEPRVEIHTKQSDDYENQYNKQAAIYHMDETINSYVEAQLQLSDYNDMTDKSTTDDSDYEEIINKVYGDQASDVEYESSDSEWEEPRKVPKRAIDCDECGKKFATKRGLDAHKRAHARWRARQNGDDQEPILDDDDADEAMVS